mmetsp:Transcript_21933/g.54186  ORF Transcript_21933/g.54186 Transcript_21933/m.54186 type:complete len:364 (-) Transcript_21933:232-1323(-)
MARLRVLVSHAEAASTRNFHGGSAFIWGPCAKHSALLKSHQHSMEMLQLPRKLLRRHLHLPRHLPPLRAIQALKLLQQLPINQPLPKHLMPLGLRPEAPILPRVHPRVSRSRRRADEPRCRRAESSEGCGVDGDDGAETAVYGGEEEGVLGRRRGGGGKGDADAEEGVDAGAQVEAAVDHEAGAAAGVWGGGFDEVEEGEVAVVVAGDDADVLAVHEELAGVNHERFVVSGEEVKAFVAVAPVHEAHALKHVGGEDVVFHRGDGYAKQVRKRERATNNLVLNKFVNLNFGTHSSHNVALERCDRAHCSFQLLFRDQLHLIGFECSSFCVPFLLRYLKHEQPSTGVAVLAFEVTGTDHQHVLRP